PTPPRSKDIFLHNHNAISIPNTFNINSASSSNIRTSVQTVKTINFLQVLLQTLQTGPPEDRHTFPSPSSTPPSHPPSPQGASLPVGIQKTKPTPRVRKQSPPKAKLMKAAETPSLQDTASWESTGPPLPQN
ncbi:unnamed protein product, partial [Gulo gulo]